ncbi:hypothetical protein [Cupriavidus necator]|uniref:hypothetical protein n=1 Tax=Cupriavidus necator TaxID=106590 RepID=UPI0005B50565|nr:hypothetical protein [Cupriavidus necator]
MRRRFGTGGRLFGPLLAYAALLAVAVWLVAFAAASLVRENEQASVGARLGATVNTTARLLEVWACEQRRRTVSIASLQDTVRLARPLLAAQGVAAIPCRLPGSCAGSRRCTVRMAMSALRWSRPTTGSWCPNGPSATASC